MRTLENWEIKILETNKERIEQHKKEIKDLECDIFLHKATLIFIDTKKRLLAKKIDLLNNIQVKQVKIITIQEKIIDLYRANEIIRSK